MEYHSYASINRILGQAHYTKNDSYALEEVLKKRMVTQHKNKRLALRRGKQGLTRARAFYFKNRGKKCFERCLLIVNEW